MRGPGGLRTGGLHHRSASHLARSQLHADDHRHSDDHCPIDIDTDAKPDVEC
jgi:hypothetical protein